MKLTKTQKIQEDAYFFPYHYVDLKVDLYDKIYNVFTKVKREVLTELVKLKKKTKVLDVGCGDGRFCFAIKNICDVEGVDYSKRAIAFSRLFNPEVKFHVRDITKTSMSKKYDVIFLIETLEHIQPQKTEKFFQNISKSLKNDGKLIITVPSNNFPVLDKHYQHFSEKTLRALISKYFVVEKFYFFNKYNYQRTLYSILERIGLLFYLFKKRIKSNYYYRYLHKYFKKHLAFGSSSNCRTIIVICEKRK